MLRRTVGGINEISIPYCGLNTQHCLISACLSDYSKITPLQPHRPTCLVPGCPAGSCLSTFLLYLHLQTLRWLPPSHGSGLCTKDPSPESFLTPCLEELPSSPVLSSLSCIISLTLFLLSKTVFFFITSSFSPHLSVSSMRVGTLTAIFSYLSPSSGAWRTLSMQQYFSSRV